MSAEALPTALDLRAAFPTAVGELSLASLVQLDQPRPPSQLGRYSLVPIVSWAPVPNTSMWSTAQAVTWDVLRPDGSVRDDVLMGYVAAQDSDGQPISDKPFLDGEFTIGLTFRRPGENPAMDRLVAIVSALVPAPGLLRLNQSQAVWTQHEDRRRDAGLQGGFLWRRALTRAMIEIARQQGFRQIEIMGYKAHHRHGWTNAKDKKRWEESYDKVAENLGFRNHWWWKGLWKLQLGKKRWRYMSAPLPSLTAVGPLD